MDSEKIGTLTDAVRRGRISRRDFLKAAVGLGLSMPAAVGLLQGCAPAPAATPTPTIAPGVTPSPIPTAPPTPTPVPTKTSAVIGQIAAARGLDPFFMAQPSDLSLMCAIYDSLFDLEYEPVGLKPNLVEDWEQVDDLTWTLKLKEGIQFHKGWGEVRAEDWAFWVNKVVTEQGAPYFIFGSGMVEEAVVTDTYTVEVHLSQPWAALPLTSLVTYGGFVFSKDAYEEMGPEEFAMNPIGTGPFELESWTPGGEVVMKKFEDYHNPDLPKLEELIFVGIEDPVVRLEKIKAGEINWTLALDMSEISPLREDPNVQVLEGGGWNWDYITFNMALEDRPWQDKRVRQAVSYAVDREAIVQSIYYGGAVAADDPLCDGYLGADPDPQFYPNTADPDKARALLAEAGYADGFTMPCLTSEKTNLRRELQVVADMLRQVGITVEIEQTDAATYRTRWHNLEFETILEDAGMASPDSDSAVYWWYHSSETGATNDAYSNPEVDELLDRGRTSSDSEERASAYRQVLEVIAEECPKVIICHINEQYVLSAGLTGFYPTPQRMFPYFKAMYWSA